MLTMSRDRKIRRARGRTALAAGLAVTAAMAVPVSAEAAVAASASTSNPTSKASAKWNWVSGTTLNSINLTVSDVGCDSEPVFARFRVTRVNGDYFFTQKRYDYTGCDTGDSKTYTGLSLSDGYNIKNVRLQVCDDAGRWCSYSAAKDNPYT